MVVVLRRVGVSFGWVKGPPTVYRILPGLSLDLVEPPVEFQGGGPGEVYPVRRVSSFLPSTPVGVRTCFGQLRQSSPDDQVGETTKEMGPMVVWCLRPRPRWECRGTTLRKTPGPVSDVWSVVR